MTQSLSDGQKSPIVLVSAADDNYALPLAVTLYSLLSHLSKGSSVCVYVLDGGIRAKNREKLRCVCASDSVEVDLRWIKPDTSSLSRLRTYRWMSPAAYLRLLIPDILPAHLEKAIYLDSDLMVETDLTRLWEKEMRGHALLAVQDYGIPYVSSHLGISRYAELGLPPDAPYFNSGMLVIDLKKWREEHIFQKALSYLQEYHEDIQFADQDALNVALAGRWGIVDLKWNVSPMTFTRVFKTEVSKIRSERDVEFRKGLQANREELLVHPYITHFCGATKPWRLLQSKTDPAERRWIAYLKDSGWYGFWGTPVWETGWHIGRSLAEAKVGLGRYGRRLRRRMYQALKREYQGA